MRADAPEGSREARDLPVLPQAGASPAARLSFVIPVFDAESTLVELVDAVVGANPGHPLQVVLVNDCSRDGSAAACRLLARRHAGVVTFVDLAGNVGEHNAVMAGLAHADGDYCVVMDDDFQNPPAEGYRLAAEAVRSRRDIVFGCYPEKRHHWARNAGSRLANAMARRLMRLPPGLYLSSFKCLSRFAVDQVLAYRGPFPYVDGLALRATRNIGVVPTLHEPTRKARSGYTVGKLLRLWGTMAVNFSILPLRLATGFGMLFSALGLAGVAAVVVERIGNPGLPVGWSSLIVAVLLLSGVQLLLLGVIGEYLGQLVLTINGTPQYVVREVFEEPGANRRARGTCRPPGARGPAAGRPAAAGTVSGSDREPEPEPAARRIRIPTFSGDNGSLSSVDGLLPFPVRRVYYIYGAKEGTVRAGHRHRRNRQALACVAGRCSVYVHDGRSERIYLLDDPATALLLEPADWHRLSGFSSDAVLLVFASEPYDVNDYIDEPYA